MKVLILQIPGHSGDFAPHTHLGELVEDIEEDLGLLRRQKLKQLGHLSEGLHFLPRAFRNLAYWVENPELHLWGCPGYVLGRACSAC